MKNPVYQILVHLFIKAFYQQHAIILGLVYLVMFGAVEANHLPEYHKTLIEGTLSSWSALAIVIGIWMIYFFMVLFFVGQVTENKQNRALQELARYSKSHLLVLFFILFTLCLLPVSTYALAIMIWGSIKGSILKIGIIFLVMLILHLAGAFYLYHKILNTEFQLVVRSFSLLRYRLPKKHLIHFYLQYLSNQQKIQWLVVKLIMILTTALCFLSNRADEEIRFSVFFFVLIFLVHTNLIKQFILWENTAFWHSRAMPVPLFKRWCQYTLFFIFLVLPEIFMIVRAYPAHLSFSNMMGLLFLCIGLLQFIFSAGIASDNIQANYTPLLFLILILCYIAALAEMLLPFAVLLLPVSGLIYTYSYRAFELSSAKEADSYT